MNPAALPKKLIFRALQWWIARGTRKTARIARPAGAVVMNRQGHLVVGGCDTLELAEAYGTPLFVVDRGALEAQYRSFAAGLQESGVESRIFYSYKTNPVPGILRVLHGCGAGAEVISPYELWLAGQLGVPPQEIVYNGPNKSRSALRTAIDLGIRLININSQAEMELIEEMAAASGHRVRAGVRITPASGWGGQFGLKVQNGEALAAFAALAQSSRIEAAAIHFHLGTNLKHARHHLAALAEVFALMAEIRERFGLSIRELDLGGGFGVPSVRPLSSREIHWNAMAYKPYPPEPAGAMPEIGALLGEITTAVAQLSRRYRLDPPTLLFEPGRVLTSGAEILLTRIGDLRATTHGFPIALLDAGVNIARPLTFEYHDILAAARAAAPRSERMGLAGPICTPMDFFIKSAALPPVGSGDLLAIMDAGAYFTAFANDFSFPRPAIVMASDGSHRVIRAAEGFEDLIARDRLVEDAPRPGLSAT